MPLIILLIVALMVLFTFSALWWRFALAIHAFFKYLSEPFAFLAEKCLQAREGCRRGIERLLMWPPVRQGQNTGREEYSAAMDVVARLVLLIMSIAVFGGDLPFAQQRNAFILGLTNLTHIPLPLDVLGGILWLAVPALFGILVLDLLVLTPSGTRLFSHIESKLVRRCFVAIAFIFLALAIFETALFFYYGQLPISSNLLIQEWKELALPIVFAFGLLIAAVSVVALWAFIFGFTGLLSVLVCVFYCVFALFYLVSSLIHMAVFGLGKMLTYVQLRSTELEDHKPVKVISGDIVLLPQPHEQDEIAPETQAQEEIMMKVHMRNIVAFSFERRSLAALDRFLGKLNHISGAELLLGYGGIDPYHSVKPEELTKVPGAKNITPSSKTLNHVLMQHGGGERGVLNRGECAS